MDSITSYFDLGTVGNLWNLAQMPQSNHNQMDFHPGQVACVQITPVTRGMLHPAATRPVLTGRQTRCSKYIAILYGNDTIQIYCIWCCWKDNIWIERCNHQQLFHSKSSKCSLGSYTWGTVSFAPKGSLFHIMHNKQGWFYLFGNLYLWAQVALKSAWCSCMWGV